MGIKKISDEEEKTMVAEYIQGSSVSVLMQKYGFKSKKSITDKLKKHYPSEYKDLMIIAKNNRKNYHIDFEKINSEFNAYFIGLMITDGYIIDENRFGIDLTDRDCIEFISKITNRGYKEYSSSKNIGLPRYRIVFSDNDQIKNLKRFGVLPLKSLTLCPPRLLEEEIKFIPYIIRGIIDGNGCIYKTAGGSAAFYICTMSYDFAIWIKNILENNLFMKDISITKGNDGIWLIGTALQSNIFKLIVLVYDKPYGMSRKYLKLRETFRDYNLGNQIFSLC